MKISQIDLNEFIENVEAETTQENVLSIFQNTLKRLYSTEQIRIFLYRLGLNVPVLFYPKNEIGKIDNEGDIFNAS